MSMQQRIKASEPRSFMVNSRRAVELGNRVILNRVLYITIILVAVCFITSPI